MSKREHVTTHSERGENGVHQLACSRGAASPDAHTQKRLFAASAGFCQNPACSRELFIDLPGQAIHIAEIAHVFAASDRGPRANPTLSEAERGLFGNLILLCAACHTIVDKAPQYYTDDIILRWKRDHENKLQSVFGIVRFDNRPAVRSAIERQLLENRAIFTKYGPHIEAALDPESGAADRWRRKMLSRIIPNNRLILAFLDANIHLLHNDETNLLEDFRQHIDDLEARHLEDFDEGGAIFPTGMFEILKD